MRLKDKVALVTGAGSGFGEGIVRRFVKEGAKVVVADVNAEAADRVAREIQARSFQCDVSKNEQVKAMVDATVDWFGRIDILVNNAGIAQKRGSLLDVTEDEFDRIYAVNVKSIYLAAIHAVPHMRAQGGGVIINAVPDIRQKRIGIVDKRIGAALTLSLAGLSWFWLRLWGGRDVF